MVSFIIAPSGDVQAATVTDTTLALNLEPLHTCMLTIVRRLRFPAPEGNGVVGVNYPWVFSTPE